VITTDRVRRLQDTFTSAVYTNLELDALKSARAILDNYLTDFTDDKAWSTCAVRNSAVWTHPVAGREIQAIQPADVALIAASQKIEATAAMMIAMQDESLRLKEDSPGMD